MAQRTDSQESYYRSEQNCEYRDLIEGSLKYAEDLIELSARQVFYSYIKKVNILKIRILAFLIRCNISINMKLKFHQLPVENAHIPRHAPFRQGNREYHWALRRIWLGK